MNYKIIEHGTVYEDEKLFGYAAWPTIAKTSDGTLLVACSAFRLQHVCPFGKSSIIKSFDGGKTWSAPMPVIDTLLDDRDGGLCVFKDKIMFTSFNNTIAFQRSEIKAQSQDKKDILKNAYCDCIDSDEAEKYLGSTYKISTDGGNTFGDTGILQVTSPHGPCCLNDGRLFYVGRAFSSPESNPQIIYHHPNLHARLGGKETLSEGLYYIFSDDDGQTWTEPKELPYLEELWSDGRFCCEPHAIQLKNGRILVQFRVEKRGCAGWVFGIYQCYSDDNGKTFSVPTMTVKKGSPPHLLELSDGRVLCTYGYRSEPFGQRAKLSTDGGETWGDEIILRDDGLDGDLGYPSTVELDDGSLMTVYYQRLKGHKNAGIYYTKWRIEK